MTRFARQKNGVEEDAMVASRSVLLATVTVVLILTVSGEGYRILARYLARSNRSVPLPQGALDKLPMRIGAWVGKDVPMDEAIIKATDTDARINRFYTRAGESVGLYVAYGVRARDLMPHRPEVCYPGGGWTLEDSRDTELTLTDRTKLRCRILRFSRTGLAIERVTVLNYYIVDGEYWPDVSLLRSKIWRGSKSVHYVAQVQITCPWGTGLTDESADRTVCAFAVDSAALIYGLFPPVDKQQ